MADPVDTAIYHLNLAIGALGQTKGTNHVANMIELASVELWKIRNEKTANEPGMHR